ncbi:MAG: LysR substrate-binding domain-containing protein [Blautia sp.]
MDIKGMLYFISTAENLSFTRAAAEQNVTQTAISLSISKMEEELGFQLFIRNKRSVQLTEAGKDFYENIVNVVKEYEEAVEHGRLTADGKVGEIRLGVPDFLIGASIKQALHNFQQNYPKISIKTKIIPPHKGIQAIENHEIDALIGFPQEFEGHSSLEYRIFRKDKLIVAMAPDHPLAACDALTLEQISGQTAAVVHPQKAPMIYLYMCGLWAEIGFKPQNVIHSDTLADALLEVVNRNAIILISDQCKNVYGPFLEYRSIKELDDLCAEISFAWKKPRTNPIIKGLLWALLGEDTQNT